MLHAQLTGVAAPLSARSEPSTYESRWGLDPHDIDAARLGDLYRYWLSRCSGDRAPMRADLDPVEIPDLLRFLYLLDVVGEARQPRFRYRLVGTQLVHWWGADPTGSQVDATGTAPHLSLWNAVVTAGKPRFDRVTQPSLRKEYQNYGQLLQPLLDARGDVVMVLGGVEVYDRPSPA